MLTQAPLAAASADSRPLAGGWVCSGSPLVAEIMAGDDVDGALVGGASLVADDFIGICTYQNA